MSGTATQAFVPYGTLVKFASAGVSSSPTYDVTLGEVVNITKAASKLDVSDASHMQSPSGYKEKIGGLKEGGTWTFEVNYVPGDAGQVGLNTIFETQLPTSFQLTLPKTGTETTNGGVFKFNALVVENLDLKLPADKKATGTFKVEVTGPVSFTAGS